MTAPTPAEPGSRKPRVAVVFGGRSSEHGISCVTAGSVLAAIDRDKYDVVPVGIATDGRWVLEADEPAALAIRDNRLPAVDGGRAPVALLGGDGKADLVVAEPARVPQVLGEVDVVFPLLHGPWGEDGTIQGLLEMAGVRYVGSGVLASAVGMDKVYMKIAFQAAGLPVTPGIVISRREWEQDQAGAIARLTDLGFPCFAKPPRSGSSIGISRVDRVEQVADAMELALRYDAKVLVEVAMLGAREIECGVLGTVDADAETTRPGEVRAGGEHTFYDFEAKYLADQQTRIDIPADLPADVEQQVRAMALRAFEALSCEGLARVDFFLMPDGSLIINELNTMPGFTPTSMYPQMWAESGLTYPELVDRLITLALSRDTGLR
ncbi:D-alanine--D-alanine ligase A [Nocardioides gansuensis]|uniref:D-alanine--D-alanine ligase n=1 Tax=Nocardioides gansuensis TaxID=2138300 RepID=A0A2T8FA97_9ACTN|nr:D-alanine--D-alanine ligase family protein [Nocardioides gansuensis]PVG82619.1 D-alanine--D-alanine ligase A [Nocardioides gansuensis]